MRMSVPQLVLTLTCLLTEVLTVFSYTEQFIRDILNSQNVNQCDFGYVSDYKVTHQIAALTDR